MLWIALSGFLAKITNNLRQGKSVKHHSIQMNAVQLVHNGLTPRAGVDEIGMCHRIWHLKGGSLVGFAPSVFDLHHHFLRRKIAFLGGTTFPFLIDEAGVVSGGLIAGIKL